MFLLTLKRDLYFGYNSHDSQKKKNLPSYFNVKNSVAAFKDFLTSSMSSLPYEGI